MKDRKNAYRIEFSVNLVDDNIRQASQGPFARTLDFSNATNAGKEGDRTFDCIENSLGNRASAGRVVFRDPAHDLFQIVTSRFADDNFQGVIFRRRERSSTGVTVLAA